VADNERQPWHPGARVDRLRASKSYGFVLALVLFSVVFLAFAPDSRWAWSSFVLLQAFVFLVAVWTSGLGDVTRRPAIALAAVSLVLAWVQYSWVTEGRELIGVFNVVLIVGTCFVIGVGVVDQGTINAQSVLGVVTVYLLLGVLFTFAFSAVAIVGDGPFFAQGTDGTLSDRLYFSYVTLATLGYGDFTPLSTTGRMLAVAEALFGQLYLVTVVAVVVGRLRAVRLPQ
jgi:voltage-gated potassium channel